MKTTVAALLGVAVGALIVFLCIPKPAALPPTPPDVGRYLHVSTEKMPADERTGLLSGLSDRIIDTTTGKIYQRTWMLKATSQGAQESVGFQVFDPVGMSTNAEKTLLATK